MSRSLSTPDSISEVLFLDLKPEQLEKSLINFHIHMSHPPLTHVNSANYLFILVCQTQKPKTTQIAHRVQSWQERGEKSLFGTLLEPLRRGKVFSCQNSEASGWMDGKV